jgi:hypothetical protein
MTTASLQAKINLLVQRGVKNTRSSRLKRYIKQLNREKRLLNLIDVKE